MVGALEAEHAAGVADEINNPVACSVGVGVLF